MVLLSCKSYPTHLICKKDQPKITKMDFYPFRRGISKSRYSKISLGPQLINYGSGLQPAHGPDVVTVHTAKSQRVCLSRAPADDS